MGENFEKMNTPKHYNNEHGSLYQLANDWGFNAYQFDILKRIDRCYKKGQLIEDLKKTLAVFELWKKEFKHSVNYNDEIKIIVEAKKRGWNSRQLNVIVYTNAITSDYNWASEHFAKVKEHLKSWIKHENEYLNGSKN